MKINNTEITVVRASVTKQPVDVIVNAANEQMRGGAAIDGAIHEMAGSMLLKELEQKAPKGARTGESVFSSSHELPNHKDGNKNIRYIIHTVGPVWNGGGFGEATKLTSAYRSCLEIVEQHNQNVGTDAKITSIGFCSISTGKFHYPLAQAAPLALQTVVKHIQDNPETLLTRVIFAMYKPDEFDLFTKALSDLDPQPAGRTQKDHSGAPTRPKQHERKSSASDMAKKSDEVPAPQQQDIDGKLHSLLTDPGFLEIGRSRDRPNLFETLAASHMEMWHSAFVKWLIDPESHLGLGDYPLKRFLYAVANAGRNTGKQLTLSVADVEDMDFQGMNFETEYTDPELYNSKGNKVRIDIIGISEGVRLRSSPDVTTSIRIIIENKIKAQESADQTTVYYDFAKKSTENFQNDLLVFLTPDGTQQPKCDNFIQLVYQDLCDFVIKPCLDHPALPEESRYLIGQYLINLGRPVRGNRVMAHPNEEICKKIYDRHKEVLDEIFVAVMGKSPGRKRDGTISSANITLNQLVNNGILKLTDTLSLSYQGKEYSAELKKTDSGVVIVFNGEDYTSPSGASMEAKKIKSDNGWTSWYVGGAKGKPKESLDGLRKKLSFPTGVAEEPEQEGNSSAVTE